MLHLEHLLLLAGLKRGQLPHMKSMLAAALCVNCCQFSSMLSCRAINLPLGVCLYCSHIPLQPPCPQKPCALQILKTLSMQCCKSRIVLELPKIKVCRSVQRSTFPCLSCSSHLAMLSAPLLPFRSLRVALSVPCPAAAASALQMQPRQPGLALLMKPLQAPVQAPAVDGHLTCFSADMVLVRSLMQLSHLLRAVWMQPWHPLLMKPMHAPVQAPAVNGHLECSSADMDLIRSLIQLSLPKLFRYSHGGLALLC